MALAASLTVTVRFATGPSFGIPLVLDDVTSPLDTGVLGTSAAKAIDVTSRCQWVTTRRGRSRVLDTFEGGTASARLIDTTGEFDPDNGTYAGDIKPMIQFQVKATHGGSERALFSGYITDWDYQYRQDVDAAYVTIEAVDGERLLNLATVSSVSGATAGQDTGARIGKILDAVSWPTTGRNIDTGNTTCQVDDGTERTALAAIRKVAETEISGFYMATDGKARFVSRHETIKKADATPTAFDDTGAAIPFVALDFNTDDSVLANNVSATRIGGSKQTVTDSDSIDEFFDRPLDRTGLLMETDTVALDYARSILATRKDADLRIKAVQIDATPNVTATINAALDTDFFDPIKVTRQQPGGGTVSRTLTVQGISHDITPTQWLTTFNTAEPLVDGFVLDSSTRGKLNDSAAILAF